MKTRVILSSLALVCLYLGGALFLVLPFLRTYISSKELRVVLESLYSVIWAIALIGLMRRDKVSFGLSLGRLPRKASVAVFIGYAALLGALASIQLGSGSISLASAIGRYGLYVCIAPVTEELLFRSYLQKKAGEILPGRIKSVQFLSWATVLTTILFGLFHLPGALSTPSIMGWIQVAGGLIVGLFFGVSRDELKSVYPPILLHSLFNLAGF